MLNKRPLKSYVRIDGSGRVVSGSNVLRQNKPKIGNWMQIPAFECCDELVVCSTTTTTTSTTSSTTTTTTTIA